MKNIHITFGEIFLVLELQQTNISLKTSSLLWWNISIFQSPPVDRFQKPLNCLLLNIILTIDFVFWLCDIVPQKIPWCIPMSMMTTRTTFSRRHFLLHLLCLCDRFPTLIVRHMHHNPRLSKKPDGKDYANSVVVRSLTNHRKSPNTKALAH